MVPCVYALTLRTLTRPKCESITRPPPRLRSLITKWRATFFSKLNIQDSFWSIHLDEKSSYLTMFNMHHGRYRFLHMPFGLKMSQDVFEMQMDQTTDCLPSIIAIHDDICIFGHIPEEHDEHLLCMMETARNHGIIFNSAKCHIRQPQFVFMVQLTLPKACSQIPPKSKPSRIFLLQLPGKASVLSRSDKLPSAIYTRPLCQNNVPARTTFQMGLESLYRCSIPVPQSLDLSDPPQCYPGILWQVKACHGASGC